MQLVPVVALSSLSEADKKALIIADNRIAELSNWDRDILAIEYQGLHDLQFDDLEVTGFSLGEIDTILDEASEKKPVGPGPEDDVPLAVAAPVSRKGDLWILGSHRLLCGDARTDGDYARLLEGQSADLVLTDPPFNVRVDGNVSGLGKVRHDEFAMASGEMSEAEFTAFLSTFLGCAKAHSRDGAILFVFMDWRHLFELTCAGREQGLVAKNLIVWAKDNAGMGTFYRSRHELVFAFKNGDASHINTFELGQHGRYRSNVWEYAGVNTFPYRTPGRAGNASDREARRHAGRRDPGRHQAERDRTRSLCRQRQHADRRRKDRPPGAMHRVRTQILRRDRAALAGLHRQGRDLRRDGPHLRGFRGRASMFVGQPCNDAPPTA
jgi:hypothetical protein